MEIITSVSNPRIKRVAALQTRANTRREEHAFIVEGMRLFLDTPDSSIEEVYATEEFVSHADDQMAAKLQKTGYTLVSPEVFGKICDTGNPQGILAVAKSPEYTMDDLHGKGEAPLLLVLENIQDPGNLGTIFRTAEAAGVTGILMSRGTVDVTNPKTVRSTMSSVFRMPYVYSDELMNDIVCLKEKGIMVYAAHLDGTGDYDSFSYGGGTAFLIGNEGNGLSDEITAMADHLLKIPMAGRIESLNAAMAAGILVYEASRQRRHN